jgi:hypothetical protein
MNLDSVPSCEEHNTSKSMDDEYLKFVLLAGIGKNTEVSERINSLERSFSKRPNLIQKFMPNLSPETFQGICAASFTLDGERFRRVIDILVRALHFKDFNLKLKKEINVAWSPTADLDSNEALFLDRLAFLDDSFGQIQNRKNGEIFRYNFYDAPGEGLCFCRLSFYQGYPIYCIWDNKTNSLNA